MTVINTNTAAINAQATLQRVNNEMGTAMTRLSSGMRINAAKDDAAGMAIAEKMTAQIMGLNQAVRNATDGQNLIDTTEGAHVETSNMLQRLRELSVQASNDTNTASDRGKISAESKALIAEINRVAETTTFNGMKILDGSFSGKQFQIGADAGQVLNVNIESTSARDIGANQVAGLVQVATAAASPTATVAQNITISGSTGQETVALAAGVSAKTAAEAINGVSAKTNVEAKAETNVQLSGLSETGAVSFSINGKSIGSVTISDTTDLTALRDAINESAGETGITAKMGDTDGKVILTSTTGENIEISNFSTVKTGDAAASTSTTGSITASGVDADGTVLSGATETTSITETNHSTIVTGQVTMVSSKGFTATTDAAGIVATAAGSANSSLSSVANIDLTTVGGAANAIKVLDAAIGKISQQRSDLGAISNRLDSTISNLTNITSNVQAAKSQITDADFAAESTALARGQILSQAATAMLAQANASKQGVLSLLRG